MNRLRLFRGTVATACVLVAACVTVNIYFPAAEVQKAADKIVEEVRPEAGEPTHKPAAGESGSLKRGILMYLVSFWVTPAEAAVDINISSPAIRNLKASIKNRFKALMPFYQTGTIGEGNRGYLEIRDTGGLDLRKKAQIKKLVDAENADRRALYEEIMRANKLDSRLLPEVERSFANSWRNEASGRGWWIQKDDGAWAR